MKYLIAIATILATHWASAQNVIYQPTYDPNETMRMQRLLQSSQAMYDKNKEYCYKLKKWIIELKGQTSETYFNNKMDSFNSQIESILKTDLSLAKDNLSTIELNITSEIANYNKRQEIEKKKADEANNPKNYFDKGIELLKAKEYYSAIPQFQRAIELYPDYGAAYLYLGVCNYFTQNRKEAESNFIRSNQYQPATAAYEYLGWICMDSHRPMEALTHFNRQIEMSPGYEMAYYNRGSAKSELKDIMGAITDYKKAIGINPKFSMAYNNIGWAYFEQKNYVLAQKYVDTSITIDPNNSVAWDSRSEIAFNQQKYQAAIEAANVALEINPETANSYLIRGRAKYRLGKQKEACADWSMAGQYGKTEAYEYIQKYCNQK